jgi:hypothetical protein
LSGRGKSRAELSIAGVITVPKEPPYDVGDHAFDQSHNMSGLFCPPGAKWCLMVADELSGLHRFTVRRNGKRPEVVYEAGLDLGLPPDALLTRQKIDKTQKIELDLEAIANDGNQVVFVGSHANKRNSGAVNPCAHLVAVADSQKLGSKTKISAQWASLDELLNKQLPGKLKKQLQCGGINIEGATVLDGMLMIGLRSPTRGGPTPGAYVISTPFAGLLKEDFSGARLHVLPTEAPFIGIRSMETVDDTVLLVTGDAGVNKLDKDAKRECSTFLNKEDSSRPFQLRAWRPGNGDEMEPSILATFPSKWAQRAPNKKKGKKPAARKKRNHAKVEGIAVLSSTASKVSLLVVYDGSDKVFYLPDVKLP